MNYKLNSLESRLSDINSSIEYLIKEENKEAKMERFINLESKIKDQVNLDCYFDTHAPPLYLLYSQYTFYC